MTTGKKVAVGFGIGVLAWLAYRNTNTFMMFFNGTLPVEYLPGDFIVNSNPFSTEQDFANRRALTRRTE